MLRSGAIVAFLLSLPRRCRFPLAYWHHQVYATRNCLRSDVADERAKIQKPGIADEPGYDSIAGLSVPHAFDGRVEDLVPRRISAPEDIQHSLQRASAPRRYRRGYRAIERAWESSRRLPTGHRRFRRTL